jgi:hypothetical protein
MVKPSRTTGPKLRLHRDVESGPLDVIPFPGMEARRPWRPHPDLAITGLDEALDDVSRHLTRLSELLNDDADNDRPRAA